MAAHRSELEPFRCEVVPDRAVVQMRPVGELDLATVPLVDAQLPELWSVGFSSLVLDLREVSFLDSTAVRMLLTWHLISATDGMVFGVIAGPPTVQHVLEVAGCGRAPYVLVARRLETRCRSNPLTAPAV